MSEKNTPQKVSRFIDNVLTKDDGAFRIFLLITLVGIFLRLLVLPFFGHIDFFSEQRRIFNLYQEGNLFLGSRFITAFTEYLSFNLFAPLIPEKSSMFMVYDLSRTTASHLHFFEWVEHHAIFRAFFFLKLPYLVFDVAIGFVLYFLFNDKKASNRAAFIWFFNPITFFAFHIFARFESIPIFHLAMALLFLKKDKIIPSFLFLGLAIWAREINIVILPFFILYLFKNPLFKIYQKVTAFGTIVLLTAFSTNVIPSMIGMHNRFRGNASESIASFDQSLQLIGFRINWYYPFMIIYGLLLIHFLLAPKVSYKKLFTTIGLFYCLFFTLVMHSVHYVSWAALIFTILSAENKRMAQAFAVFCLSWIVFWLINSDLAVFTHWLAMPASLFFSSIPTFPKLFVQYVLTQTAFDLYHVVPILRSFQTAALIYCAITIFNRKKEDASWTK